MTIAPASTAARVARVLTGMPAADGAGVRLSRLIGTPQLDALDPFLMLDEFGTDRPQDYLAGFPDHPHRGFETVTYMLEGRMRHRDNKGNEGVLVPGSVQWMTAGRGLVHSEMPEQQEGRMRGFQLWINLPARDKLVDPKYQEFAPGRIPRARVSEGVELAVIAGRVGEVTGPVDQPATSPVYLDATLAGHARWAHALPEGHAGFVYVFEGDARVGRDATHVGTGQLAALADGHEVAVQAGSQGARVLLVAGRPLREPVARYGPFVMNTQDEIREAFADYQAGRF